MTPNGFMVTYIPEMSSSKWIGECHILSGKFEQHGIIEEFVDGYVLTKTLTATRFHHKFTGQMCRWLRL